MFVLIHKVSLLHGHNFNSYLSYNTSILNLVNQFIVIVTYVLTKYDTILNRRCHQYILYKPLSSVFKIQGQLIHSSNIFNTIVI